MKTALALAVALAVAVALALFIRALVYAVIDAVHLLADRKKGAISVNQDADAEHDDTHRAIMLHRAASCSATSGSSKRA
jgi:hypothetical protein